MAEGALGWAYDDLLLAVLQHSAILRDGTIIYFLCTMHKIAE